ncbi:hypothetical protein CEXT_309081 [Caerostris extrusa]|uniref:Uncharacterized protein n=1 Tax=Caerostris extrusa TaxID=172846 RepID=A0AAV4UEC3_CAEEX|nr:hypothetical protein CEXT_309081 [Caerostris extrusa]
MEMRVKLTNPPSDLGVFSKSFSKSSGASQAVQRLRGRNEKMMWMLYLMMILFAAAAQMPESFKSLFFPENNENTITQGPESLSRFQAEVDAAQNHFQTGDVPRYIKTEPIHQPQCHVEVQVVQRRSGHCIRLGGSTPACQTNEFLYPFNAECMAKL